MFHFSLSRPLALAQKPLAPIQRVSRSLERQQAPEAKSEPATSVPPLKKKRQARSKGFSLFTKTDLPIYSFQNQQFPNRKQYSSLFLTVNVLLVLNQLLDVQVLDEYSITHTKFPTTIRFVYLIISHPILIIPQNHIVNKQYIRQNYRL